MASIGNSHGGGVPEDKRGMLGWDLSGCNFGPTNINVLAQLNIDAFFKKTWPKDIVKELKSKR